MMTLTRTDSTNPDFLSLVALLDRELAIIDGDDASFYAQLNKVDAIKNCLVVYENGKPVGCGAFKKFSDEAVEVKRMYVVENLRGKGIASSVVRELEKWASELGYTRCVLETGKRQPDAIALYSKLGYKTTPNYGKYIGMDNSVCFEKPLT